MLYPDFLILPSVGFFLFLFSPLCHNTTLHLLVLSGIMGFRKEDPRGQVPFASCDMKVKNYHVLPLLMLTLIPWWRWYLSGFPLSIPSSLERSRYAKHLFHGLGCSSLLFYFVCCSNCFSFGYWELFQLAPSWALHGPPSWWISVTTFLLSSTTRCSKFIWYPCPSSGISHPARSTGSFYEKRCLLETKIWVLGSLLLLGAVASGSSQLTEQRNVCVYTSRHASVCVHLCL